MTVAPASDPAVLVREFSTWLRAKRAALPDYPGGSAGIVALDMFNREARAKREAEEAVAMTKYHQIRGEAQRQARASDFGRLLESLEQIAGNL